MTALGGPEVLELQDVGRPEPIPTEVLVRITAAGINPVDWKTRRHGGFRRAVGEPPLILGWDIAGVVEEIDPDVTRFAPGDRVFGMPWFPRLARGYAQYASSPARQLARTPEALSDEQAGGLPLAGLTAWQALVDLAGVAQGTRVLIHAAAGGVGHLAVQIARARGAHVIGTAREERHTFLAELGIDESIDYTAGPFEEAVSDVDVVLDLVGGEDYGLRSLKTLREGGLWICIPADVPDAVAAAAREQSKRAVSFLVEPDYAGLESLAALADEGKLTVAIDETFPLAQAAEAHRRLEDGRARGKIVLIP
ncbi:MAG TPA: NADP-dependent oxidoreductase [Solirubrobacterales bacterium]|nr:NADP-dependent oxidoreductase [Solirubrobacterales bacterium]